MISNKRIARLLKKAPSDNPHIYIARESYIIGVKDCMKKLSKRKFYNHKEDKATSN